MTKTPSERMPGLDALRFFAALSVVAYHGLFRGPHAPWGGGVNFPGLENVAVYGCLGVDLFFVISGFVIAWSAEGRGAGEFARARLLRLWPGFVFCMTLSAAIQAMAGDPQFPITLPQWLANLTLVPILFREPFVNGAYWTIFAEITFYAWVWLAIATGQFQRRLLTIGWIWLAIAVANPLVLHSGLLKFVLLTNYAGHFLGGLLLYRCARGRLDFAGACLLAASVAVALTSGGMKEVCDIQASLGHPMDVAVIRALILAAFSAVALGSQVRLEGWAARVAYVAGGLTYPTYLLHENVEYLLSVRLFALGVPALAAFVAIIAGVMAVAYAVFRWVEPAGKTALRSALEAPAILGRQPLRARSA